MSTLATFLIGIAGSLANQFYSSLGIAIVSYAALTALCNTIITQIQTTYNALPAATLQLANLGGLGEFLAIVPSAIFAEFAMMQLKRFRIT